MNNEIFDLIEKKEFTKLKEFILKNLDFNYDIYDNNFNYFINILVLNNQIDLIHILLKKTKTRLDIIDSDGRNIIYLPIKYNYIKVLEILLEADKNIIGVSIIDNNDKLGLTGLHYATIFNNIEAFKLLFNYGADLFIVDYKNKLNIIETALQYKRIEILNYIFDKLNDFSFKSLKGESLFQSILSYELFEFTDQMLDKNININNKENEYGFTALHQTVILDNFELSKKLLNKNADINLQDKLGNNSLHYSIIENNIRYLKFVIDNEYKISYNFTNLNGDTILHLLLNSEINIENNDQYNSFEILKLLIKNTNLNLQNNSGITCGHLIIENDLWKNESITTLLKEYGKIINIFINDNNNMNGISRLVDNNDSEDLINLIVDIYYNKLQQIKDKSKLELKWEYMCATNDVKNLMKELNKRNNDIVELCKTKIKEIIKEKKKSIPSLKQKVYEIDYGIFMENCFYTGSLIDIVFSLVWLQTNNSNINFIIDYPLTENQELVEHYRRIGVDLKKKNDFINIEILWSYQSLIFPNNFFNIFNSKNVNRYTIIPLGIELSNGSHANIILVDNDKKIIERFEPNGNNNPKGFYYNEELLDNLLSSKLLEILPDYKYYSPKDYEPIIGFQILETLEDMRCKKIGDPNGFCAIWCTWWIHQKINNDINSAELIDILINKIKFQNKSFKNLIRNFSIKIAKLRDNHLKKYSLEVDDWLVNNYDKNILNDIESDILKYF